MNEGPNPTGVCMCGCGQPAPISKYTDKRRHLYKGQHTRFIRGHSTRVNPAWRIGQRRENERRKALIRPRREKAAELYRRGMTYEQIAEMLGVSFEVVNQDIRAMRVAGADLSYRAVWTRTYVTPEIAAEVEGAWGEHLSVAEIGERFGWSRVQAASVAGALRRAGFALDKRNRPVRLDDDERRRVVREYRKRKTASGKPISANNLRDTQKVALRFIGAVGRPVAAGEVVAFCDAAGVSRAGHTLEESVRRLYKRGLLERVPSRYQGRQRWLYFVPLGGERSATELTLADAQRETELARLIEAQEREVARGDWAEVDFRTTSLDAERGEGATLYDFIEDAA